MSFDEKLICYDWIKWDGGDCPVDGSVKVDVKLRNDHLHTRPAKCFTWEHTDHACDIVEYRITDVNPWRKWESGDLFVNKNAKVSIKLRCGALHENVTVGDEIWTQHTQDIIAFRFIDMQYNANFSDVEISKSNPSIEKPIGVANLNSTEAFYLGRSIGNAIKMLVACGSKDNVVSELQAVIDNLQEAIKTIG